MDSNRLIRLVDGSGEEVMVEEGGQLNPERHAAVMTAIYGRSQRITSRKHGDGTAMYGNIGLWDEVWLPSTAG